MGSNIRIVAESETLVEAKVVMRDGRPVLEDVKVHSPNREDDSSGDANGDTPSIASLSLTIAGAALAEATRVFLRAPGGEEFPGEIRGAAVNWSSLQSGAYMLLAAAAGSEGEGYPLTLARGNHAGTVNLEMRDGLHVFAGGEIAQAPGGNDPDPGGATGDDTPDPPPEQRRPNMVVDYFIGPNGHLSHLNDPRHVLSSEVPRTEGEPSMNSRQRFSPGKRGWIILGFDEGFYADPDYMVRFTESGDAAEWLDIWVAKDIDENSPVNYRGDGDYTNLRPASLANIGKGRRIQGGDSNARPDWVPNQWHYVGAVQGNPGTEADGPHLGTVPRGHYRYMLLHDAGSANNAASNKDWDGADIIEIGIYLRNDIRSKDTYHLLVVDLSASVESVHTKYRDLIKKYIQALVKRPGKKHYLGLRVFGGFPHPDRKKAPKLVHETRRVRLSGQFWLPITPGTTSASEVWDSVRPHLVFRGGTPLTAAIRATIDVDLRLPGTEIPPTYKLEDPPGPIPSRDLVEVILITDGLPDANAKLPEKVQGYSPTQRTKAKTDIKDKVVKALEDLKKIVKGYHIEIIGAFFTGTGDEFRKQVFDLYAKAQGKSADGKTKELLARILDLESGAPAVEPARTIDHAVVPHTDCDHGNRAQSRRIGGNEKKRFTYGSTTAGGVPRRLRTPLAWGETARENVAESPGGSEGGGTPHRVANHALPSNNLEPE